MWGRPHRESEDHSSEEVEEEEAGGPEGRQAQRAGAGTRAAGQSGATARHSEAHGCCSAGAGRSCEALVERSRHRHSRKEGGRTRGMAVCPGRQAGGCRPERMGVLKTAVAAGASSHGSPAQAHLHYTDPS